MQNNNKYNSHLLPLITPEMLTRYPDQTCAILNKLIGMQGSVTVSSGSQAPGNLENIEQTTTSYDDGGVNIVTAYLSDGTTQDFQIRNGHKGSQGEPGADGTDGQDATIAVGTTTTLPAGSSATVTDSGTPSAAVLNFGIPKGADGQDGQDGFSPIATVSKVGDTATITITDENGTTTASVTDGTDGAPGQAATVTAGTTTTLPAGSNASVVNSGTSSAAVFDFSIPKGDTGAAGQDGADGADGFSPIATVSKVGDTATITITDENGTTTASVTDGSDGAPGAAATIAAGTTTTLSPGSSATVTNSGTSSAAVFDFGIPQGATGSPGADGADGADGFSPIATVTKSGDTATISITDANGTTTASVSDGATGPAGPSNTLSIGTVQSGATAAATITGTSPNQTLNLTLPKGDTGSPGAAATIAVGTTSTLPAGSSATVTNSGTSSAAVFNFGVPKGDTGDTGAAGPANTLAIGTVTSGSTASATITGTSPNQTLNLVLPKGDPGTPANVINTQSTTSTTDAYSAKYTEEHFQAKDSVTTITKSLQFKTTWTDTGITSPDLPADGLYAMYVLVNAGSGGQWIAGYSAVISWRQGDTNDSKTDEILLTHTGHADNGADNGQRLFLRTAMTGGHGNLKLQYAFRLATYQSITGNITFTFRRLI